MLGKFLEKTKLLFYIFSPLPPFKKRSHATVTMHTQVQPL